MFEALCGLVWANLARLCVKLDDGPTLQGGVCVKPECWSITTDQCVRTSFFVMKSLY